MISKTTKMRLHRYLAHCGVASRRECERLIEKGIVSVDGQKVTEQGMSIDPETQLIKVNGKNVFLEKKSTILFNKPKDVVCTVSDPEGRRTCMDFVQSISDRIYPVGRLDRDSEGLLILTNDGDLSYHLTHPRHLISKTYLVWVDQELSPFKQQHLLKGVLDNGQCLKAHHIEKITNKSKIYCYKVILKEGRNRQLRRMFEALDLSIHRLQRVAIGAFPLGSLKRGNWRYLTEAEVSYLKQPFSSVTNSR